MKKIPSLILMILLLSACRKAVLPELTGTSPESFTNARQGGGGGGGGSSNPVVTTSSVNVNSAIQSIASGTVSSGGKSSSITERGFCYSTATGPTIANDTARAGSGTGSFQRTITGLSAGTTYYIRAYAIKSGVVYYGNELNFTTLTLGMPTPGIGLVYDIDGNAYNTITLGTQVWMVENLKTTRLNDGTALPNITDNYDWIFLTTPAYCDYNNDPSNSTAYGRLYNREAANDSRIAPSGWRVPTLTDWDNLLRFLGGVGVAGGRMKEAGFTHWASPNTAADNSSQFTAVGAGVRAGNPAVFSDLMGRTIMWGQHPTSDGWVELQYNSASYNINWAGSCCTYNGYSIRLVKN